MANSVYNRKGTRNLKARRKHYDETFGKSTTGARDAYHRPGSSKK